MLKIKIEMNLTLNWDKSFFFSKRPSLAYDQCIVIISTLWYFFSKAEIFSCKIDEKWENIFLDSK